MTILVVVTAASVSTGPLASEARAACNNQTQTSTDTIHDGGVTETITRTTTIQLCDSILTLTPSSAAPLATVMLTLSDIQPLLCTTEQHVRQTPLYQQVVQADGSVVTVLVGYDYVTFQVTSCVVNTAAVRFAGAQVATATPAAGGLTATFAVPDVRPGSYDVSVTPLAGTARSAALVVLDTIPPFINAAPVVPPPNSAGWNSTDVIVQFACIDADSAIASCTGPVTLSAEGAGQFVTGTAVDAAGNTASARVGPINIDKTYPTIDPRPSRSPDHGAWYTAPVTIAFDCSDALSGIALCGAPVTLSGDGRGILFTGEARDNAGNGLTFVGNVNIDKTPPTISAPPSVSTATLPGSCTAAPSLGQAVATDNLGVVTITNDAASAFPLGATKVTWTAMDPAGHVATATQTVTVYDAEAPAIAAPANISVTTTSSAGAVIAAAARGSATATDNCSAVAPTVSGVPAGDLFPIGSTVLTWSATDASGNTATATQTITVRYGACLLYDPTKAAKLGSTIPIKVQLCTAAGTNLSSAAIVLHVTGAIRTGSATATSADDAGNANPDGDFRYDATLAGYIYNLSTRDLSSGTWRLQFTANGITYEAPFQVR